MPAGGGHRMIPASKPASSGGALDAYSDVAGDGDELGRLADAVDAVVVNQVRSVAHVEFDARIVLFDEGNEGTTKHFISITLHGYSS